MLACAGGYALGEHRGRAEGRVDAWNSAAMKVGILNLGLEYCRAAASTCFEGAKAVETIQGVGVICGPGDWRPDPARDGGFICP